jgi:four helix bundle protein
MTPDELKERTFRFALDCYGLARPWFREPDTRHLAGQLVRSSSSVASNYRAACLGRTRAEFAAKIGITREEADESAFWAEFSERAGFSNSQPALLREVRREASELTRIFDASYRTSRRR